ncbi:MAG: VTT domain-containing protein [Candidatus Poseidoniaceae archaeon]|nr:VTT domain-containing protein [Candidatus Poseidoniaceae archaeon]
MKMKIASSGILIVIGGIILSMSITQILLSQIIEQMSWFTDSGIKGITVFILLYIVFGVLVIPASFHKYLSGILFGFSLGVFVAWLGSMIAAIIPFLLAKKWLNPFAQNLLKQNPKLMGLENAIITDKWKTVALTRVSLIIPYGLLNYAFGATEIKLKHYLIGNLAMIVPSIMYVWWGSQTRIIAGAIETKEKGPSYTISLIISLLLTIWLVIRSHKISKNLASFENE